MKCYFCKHFTKNNRFKCDLFNENNSNFKCSSLSGYPKYDEVDEAEYKIREAQLGIERNKEKSNKTEESIFNAKLILLGIYFFILAALLIALIIVTTIQRFHHPEMTETQLLIWEFQNHPFLIISIIVQALCWHIADTFKRK